MQTIRAPLHVAASHPIGVHIEPRYRDRDRLTVVLRPILAIPHLLLVGGPIAATVWWSWLAEPARRHEWGASGGVLGAVAVIAAMISWFAIVFTRHQPEGLWNLSAFYLRWRVRAVAYLALLRDEYPPFGDGAYAAELDLVPPAGPRNLFTVGFRFFLIIPHLIVLWLLGFAWAVATVIAWIAILVTGRHPEGLYRFAIGMVRWNIRVEAYALLLRDEYPPFTLDA
jgi:hypothetical protein